MHKIQLSCQVFKKVQLVYLENLNLSSKSFIQSLSSGSNERLVPRLDLCVGFTKRVVV
jgi:hypothetical protein